MLSALQPSRWRYTWHLAGDCIVLGMLTCSLPAKNWQVLNDMIDGHTTHTVQQICTKRHLIFTVVLVSWPIVALKRKIVHVYHKNRNTKRIVLAVGRDYQSDYRHIWKYTTQMKRCFDFMEALTSHKNSPRNLPWSCVPIHLVTATLPTLLVYRWLLVVDKDPSVKCACNLPGDLFPVHQ